MSSWQFWIDVIAIALSPVIAVQVSELLARRRAHYAQKWQVFESLMLTRAERLSPEHVRALNSVHLAFNGTDNPDRAVRAAWREYFDHLDSLKGAPATDVWTARGDELRVLLLQRIAESLKHSVEAADLRRAIYRPIGHSQLEDEQTRLRHWFLALADGKSSIPVSPFPAPNQPQIPQESGNK